MDKFSPSALLFLALSLAGLVGGGEIEGRFAPPPGEVLVFVGGDGESVGGTERFTDGYVNNIGVPAGISLALPSGEMADSGWELLEECLESLLLDRCSFHLALEAGADSTLISRVLKILEDHPDHPFFIEYSFFADRDPEEYGAAFRNLVTGAEDRNIQNVSWIFSGGYPATLGEFDRFNPGNEYFDWVGYSWTGMGREALPSLEFARRKGKPAFITGAIAGTHRPGDDPEAWHEVLLKHIEDNSGIIRAFSAFDLLSRGGLQGAEFQQWWTQQMSLPHYLNSSDKPFQRIGFPAGRRKGTSETGSGFPYQDRSLPISRRVEDLVGRMTLEEKVAQLTGWMDRNELLLRQEGAIFEPGFYGEIAPQGLGLVGSTNLNAEEDILQHYAAQEYFLHRTRLGIPALRCAEVSHGLVKLEASSFPSPIALSCTWNPQLLEELFERVGMEARSRGIYHVFGPCLDVLMDPRHGRADQMLGEDPFLVARLGTAMARGLEKAGVTNAPRYFAGAGAPQGGRNRAPYAGGRRDLLTRDFFPFHHMIKQAPPAMIAVGEHLVEGVPCRFNPWLLGNVLRDELGFEGVILGGGMSPLDRGGRFQPGTAELAFRAGVQLEAPGSREFAELADLVRDRRIDEAGINLAVSAALDLKFRLGLFEAPNPTGGEALRLDDGRASSLALDSARQAMVLLKNNGILPLDPGVGLKVAVIGPNSDVCRLGSRSGTPGKTVSLLEGIQELSEGRFEVVHAKGCIMALNDTNDSYLNWRHVNDVNFATLPENRPLIDEAISVARDSDVVILALGENELMRRETRSANHLGDRASLELTESQEELARQIGLLKKPVVLFLFNGGPMVFGELEPVFDAIVTGHYTGQETGTAAAELLFGAVNPSGKLTVSWPTSVGHLPVHYNRPAGPSAFAYHNAGSPVEYSFGHGLSYTTFHYSRPRVSSGTIRAGESVKVSFELTNTGSLAGTEIVQLYLSREGGIPVSPEKELKGFSRITLAPGETQTVDIELRSEDLWDYDWNLKRFFPEGLCQIRVGGSSLSLGESVALEMVATVDPPARSLMTDLSVPDNVDSPVGRNSAKVLPVEEAKVLVNLDETNLRQVVEGFGIPLTDLMEIPDRYQRKVILGGLNLRFLRARADQAMKTERDRIGRILRQISEIDPNLEFQLSFARPASDEEPGVDYWMDRVPGIEGNSFRLKPERSDEWAELMVSRVSQLLDSGINVTSVAIPWQEPGKTANELVCSWTPESLNGFISGILRPNLLGVGLDSIRIAVTGIAESRASGEEDSPDFVWPSLASDIVSLRSGSPALAGGVGKQVRDRIWFEEIPEAGDRERVEVARRIHESFVRGGSSAFIGNGIIRERSGGDLDPEGGLSASRFQQFSRFVQPGYRRIHLEGSGELMASAFSGPEWGEVIVVVVNPVDRPRRVEVDLSASDHVLKGCYQTDQRRRCQLVPPEEVMPPGSVRTLVFSPGF